MSGALSLRNRQTHRAVNLRQLRLVTTGLLEDILRVPEFDLVIQLVGARTMAKLNQQYMQHEGPTDVITLDYGNAGEALTGEIIICVQVAVEQGRSFGVRWQEELARYVVHGVLHLRGYDDLQAADRRRMKHEENRLVRELTRRFSLRKLEKSVKLTT